MDTEQNKTVREVTRWLRVGVLTLTTLGPIITAIVARVREQVREQAQALQELKGHPYSQEVLKRGSDLVAQGNKATQSLVEQGNKATQSLVAQGNKATQSLVAQGNKATQSLVEQGNKATQILAQQGGVLVERGSKTTQALLERGSAVTHDLTERGGKLSQDLTERGGKLSQDLLERGGKLSQDLTERGGKLSQDLLERGNKVTQEVTKRGRATTQDLTERGGKAAQSLSEQPTTFWLTFGFGLAAAAVATYLLVRNRLQQQSEAQPYQLPLNGVANGAASNGTRPLNQPVVAETTPHPADSKVFGLVSTKHYYPVETALDQLRQSKDAKLDITYFSSEEEARLQGFTPAE